jgi:hypothetical protein
VHRSIASTLNSSSSIGSVANYPIRIVVRGTTAWSSALITTHIITPHSVDTLQITILLSCVIKHTTSRRQPVSKPFHFSLSMPSGHGGLRNCTSLPASCSNIPKQRAGSASAAHLATYQQHRPALVRSMHNSQIAVQWKMQTSLSSTDIPTQEAAHSSKDCLRC